VLDSESWHSGLLAGFSRLAVVNRQAEVTGEVPDEIEDIDEDLEMFEKTEQVDSGEDDRSLSESEYLLDMVVGI